MSNAKTLSTIILALGPEVWALPAWQARTNKVILPFNPVATSASTKLEAWQLTLLRKFARRIRSIKHYEERVKFIRRGYLSDPVIHLAPDIWDTWVNPYLESWNIQSDIEDILLQFDRHPSQMLPIRSAHFVSPFLVFFSSPLWLISLQGPLPYGFDPFRPRAPVWHRCLHRSRGAVPRNQGGLTTLRHGPVAHHLEVRHTFTVAIWVYMYSPLPFNAHRRDTSAACFVVVVLYSS